jgi:TonB family protein
MAALVGQNRGNNSRQIEYFGDLVGRLSYGLSSMSGVQSVRSFCSGSALSKRHFVSQSAGSIVPRLALATLTLGFCFTAGFVPALLAQKAPKSDRKVLVSVKPEYSELLKHAQIGGLVRLKATVLPDGKVSNVDVVGGNPILAESAVTAVMKWKFLPAPAQTVEDISISFSPH